MNLQGGQKQKKGGNCKGGQNQKLVVCGGRWSISLCAHVYVKAGTE